MNNVVVIELCIIVVLAIVWAVRSLYLSTKNYSFYDRTMIRLGAFVVIVSTVSYEDWGNITLGPTVVRSIVLPIGIAMLCSGVFKNDGGQKFTGKTEVNVGCVVCECGRKIDVVARLSCGDDRNEKIDIDS